MINQVSTRNNINSNIQVNNRNKSKRQDSSPSFNGGIGDAAIKGIQYCEKNPMLNVAVIDLATAIVPRSIWESFTNIFAGFEAFRRESSGLIINCLLPGYVAWGAAKLVNKAIMGNNADMSSCWAGKDSIDKVSDYYKNAHETEAYADGMAKFNDAKKARVYATHYNMLNDASGVDGEVVKKFRDIDGLNISEAAEKLTNATFEEPKKISFGQRVKNLGNSISNMFSKNKEARPLTLLEEAYHDVAGKTHITESVTFGEGEKALVSNLKSTMQNSTKLMRGFVKDGVENPEQIAVFAKKAKKLVNAKSGIAMLLVLPLAATAQSINRWITTKSSGVEGAPIYDDYAKKKDEQQKTPEQIKADKAALLKQKFISIGSMVGVAMLSMMKLPTLSTLKNIFQFKGQFPTMDQARAISTVTFGSRMAVADDKNELEEATTRDIVTFSSMYFLGDYAAKGYASYLENSKGVKLLNKTKPVKKDANIFKKFGNWVVNTHLKSTDELAADGTRSLEQMKKLRAKCQMVNLGSSLLILGLIVPVFTRMKTKKNHAKDIAGAGVNNTVNQTTNNDVQNKQQTKVCEQKLQYSKNHGKYTNLQTFKRLVEES
ncbi:MAG: hypothetical protein NC200_02035 [Candidatus Gastranaerophilales bacterium]|nr:hypothetical protein [Candidatus Gastranaerophilales bacterium]